METKDSRKKINPKVRMTNQMRGLILGLAVIGLVSIIYLISVYSTITKNYSRITNEIYLDIESMNALNQSLYQHQTLVFEHMVTSSDEKKTEIENEAEQLSKKMRGLLSEFGKTATGSKYETYYHDIYSGIVGYTKNVGIIFDFSRSGEMETAKYYMENNLEDYLVSVNNTMKTLDDITKQDMESAKEDMQKSTEFVKISSYILLAALVIFAILSQVIGYRVSDMMVNTDGVTGVINYSNFLERLEKRQKKGSLVGFAVIAINIRGFQYINQRVGNENGDTILRKYAEIIKGKIGKNSLVARSSGDGFVVLLQAEAIENFLAFLKNIEIDLVMNSHEDELEHSNKICVGVSSRCGYYIIEEGVPYLRALENAALALKIARNKSESGQLCYEDKMLENQINQTQVIHEFKSAIERREFLVYYQPKMNMEENKIYGAEALVRWFHNDHIVPPLHFVPTLEQEGYIVDLDFYVLDTVCSAIRRWQQLGYEMVTISVNFSKLHLKNQKFADRVLDIVNKYKVDGKYLEIELTESVGYEDYESLTNFIEKMKQANISIAIDDFGTGYSSLSLMKTVDVDTVKLDKSFIDGIVDDKENEEDEILITNIVQMIKGLHKDVVCEGVETLKQAEFLKSIQCYQVQGYLFDRPLPPEEFANRLDRRMS